MSATDVAIIGKQDSKLWQRYGKAGFDFSQPVSYTDACCPRYMHVQLNINVLSAICIIISIDYHRKVTSWPGQMLVCYNVCDN